MKTKLKIGKVWIEHRSDENPDTSHLGKFSDTFAGCESAIVRVGLHRGKYCHEVPDGEMPMKCREYRFFIPAMSGVETGSSDSPKQDWQRMEGLNHGDWHYLGIIAKCEVLVPIPGIGLHSISARKGDKMISQFTLRMAFLGREEASQETSSRLHHAGAFGDAGHHCDHKQADKASGKAEAEAVISCFKEGTFWGFIGASTIQLKNQFPVLGKLSQIESENLRQRILALPVTLPCMDGNFRRLRGLCASTMGNGGFSNI